MITGSFENGLAIRRNAKIDVSKNYTDIIEVFESVRDGVVEIGLVDATMVTFYEDQLEELGLRVEKVLNTGSGYGVVLSSGLEVIADDVKNYVSTNRPFINEFVKTNVPILYVSLFEFIMFMCPHSECLDCMISFYRMDKKFMSSIIIIIFY